MTWLQDFYKKVLKTKPLNFLISLNYKEENHMTLSHKDIHAAILLISVRLFVINEMTLPSWHFFDSEIFDFIFKAKII